MRRPWLRRAERASEYCRTATPSASDALGRRCTSTPSGGGACVAGGGCLRRTRAAGTMHHNHHQCVVVVRTATVPSSGTH